MASVFGPCGVGKYIVVAAIGVGAVAGIGLYFLLRKGPGITGCVDEDAAGLQLKDEGSQRVYTLTGETGNIKPGERVHVYGKKRTAGQIRTSSSSAGQRRSAPAKPRRSPCHNSIRPTGA